MPKKKKTKLKMKRILFAFFILIALIGTTTFFITKGLKPTENKEDKNKNVTPVVAPVKKLKIIDEDSKTRPYAVMINNNHDAWPHAGLQDAYLTYEIVAEGGITRLMALFKDQDTVKIGSVRSSRHYYLDYALENDAIYVHFGWSPQAKDDISTLKINNINGLYEDSFWRDKTLDKAYEHTAFTNMEKLKATTTKKGYRTEIDQSTLLHYSIDAIDTSKLEGALPANQIDIRYSYYQTSSYEYDQESKTYKRSMSGTPHTDAITKKQYTVKNIITYQVENDSMDEYGRQELDNIGNGTGYYISNGYAVPITWEKTSRSGKTVYKDQKGKQLVVNDGNTYIQIQPKGEKLTIQ